MQKTVVLFGGSFNPPHHGHFEMAAYLHNTLQADETWMLFSQSVDKDPATYMSLEHRINMGKIMARHYSEPIILSDEEARIAQKIGRNETFYILEELKVRYPDNKFIFAMGADTFSNFHKWKERDDIIKSTIIAVVDRPGYTDSALTSPTAQAFSEQKIDITHPASLSFFENGWCFLNSPKIEVSSSEIQKKLVTGNFDFDDKFSEVAAYIRANNLYCPSTSSL